MRSLLRSARRAVRTGAVVLCALALGATLVDTAAAQSPTTTTTPTPTTTAPGSTSSVTDGSAPAAGSIPVSWSVHPAPGGEAAAGGVRPNFVLEGAPGDTLTDALVVENTSDVNLVLGVYASDAFNTPSGGTDLLAGDSDAVDLGSWTTPDTTSITVPAGGSVTVPFTIEIPDDASPGDHTGGIVTSLRLTEPDADGNRVTVERRLGTRIYLRVDGGVEPELTFTDLTVEHHGGWNPFAPGSIEVTYTVENTGNVRLRATRLVRVEPGVGGTVTAEAADMPELLPGNSYEFTQEVGGVWPAFGTTVEVELGPYATAGDTIEPAPAEVIGRTELTLWPVAQLLALVVLLALLGLWWWRRGRRSRRPVAVTPPPLPSALAPPPGSAPVEPVGSAPAPGSAPARPALFGGPAPSDGAPTSER